MRITVPIMVCDSRGALAHLPSQLSVATASIRMEMMCSDLGNELPSARKIILKCLCMRGARRTAAQANFLCVVNHLSSAEIFSFQNHPVVPVSSHSHFLSPSIVMKIYIFAHTSYTLRHTLKTY